MAEYVRILYVNTRPQALAIGGLSKDIENLRDWTWLQGALVRWESVSLQSENSPDLQAILDRLSNVRLLVLDWSSPNPEPARKVYAKLREVNPRLRVLAVDYSPGREPVRDDSIPLDPSAIVVTGADLSAADSIKDALSRLDVQLPQPNVNVDLGVEALVMQSLIESLGDDGKKQLALIVQKFFPDATIAQVDPVGGGWSGARLVRLFIGGEPNPFFLKFFPDGMAYKDEWEQHDAASKWLGDATVKVHPVPDLGSDFLSQSQAFPPTRPCVFPVCYESASTKDHARETLKEFYRCASQAEIERGLAKLLEVLSKGQPATPPDAGEPPWSGPEIGGFFLTRDGKESLLTTLEDLSLYWRGEWDEWECRRDALQRIVHQTPAWLMEWLPVIRGHIHGDPNPRNCLIARDQPDDLRLIDCGNYRLNGRLVSDLAIIERDIKLVMMGIEQEALSFYDLDVGQLGDWYQAERNAMGHGLSYTAERAMVLGGPNYCSATRAHRLMGSVRQRARGVCGAWDPKGQHYFAALLYWTLEILRYPAVRPTKKLLALYSASEILRSMDSSALLAPAGRHP